MHETEVFGFRDGWRGVMDGHVLSLTTETVRGIVHRGGTILGSSGANPFHEDGVERCRSAFKDLELDGIVAIGGDGTLSAAAGLTEEGIPVIGIPKTIDNDLTGTDLCIGFSTAVQVATDALDKLHTTAESHHRVMILEVMGRNAGWIAIESGIAGGADIILIPEIPFRIDGVLDAINKRDASGNKFSIAVTSEHAMPVEGFDNRVEGTEGSGIRYAGIGNWIGDHLKNRTEHEVRVTVLGHLQRGGSPSPFDRLLATRFGTEAVQLLANGGFGRMVAYHGPEVDSVPLSDAVGTTKTVPPDGDHVQTARALGIYLVD